jgi:heme oxygenase
MSGLHQQLRLAAREEHERLQQYPLFRAMMDGLLPLSSYVAWLRVMTTVVGVLESEVEANAERGLGRVWQPSMRKLPLLQTDVAEFDAVPRTATQAIMPTLALVETLRRWGRGDGASLIGGLYVFEGSSLGGKVLRKRLADQYRLEGRGLAYVSAYGKATQSRWRGFCKRLDALDLGEHDEARAVAAANTVFRRLGQIVKRLYPAKGDSYTVVSVLNRNAGHHEVTCDPREVLASIDAGVGTWEAYPYFEARYGERGRLFTRSDSAWLVTLADLNKDSAIDQIDWLARLLSHRGMPSLLLEKHLLRLQDTLIRAVPERAHRYRRLCRLAEHLRANRAAALPDFDRVAASFPCSEPLANVGPIIAGAVADERLGVENAARSVESWLTDPVRFSAEWVAAVERTISLARGRESQRR